MIHFSSALCRNRIVLKYNYIAVNSVVLKLIHLIYAGFQAHAMVNTLENSKHLLSESWSKFLMSWKNTNIYQVTAFDKSRYLLQRSWSTCFELSKAVTLCV